MLQFYMPYFALMFSLVTIVKRSIYKHINFILVHIYVLQFKKVANIIKLEKPLQGYFYKNLFSAMF